MSELNNSEKNDFVLYRIADILKLGNDDIYWYQELLNKYKNSTLSKI